MTQIRLILLKLKPQILVLITYYVVSVDVILIMDQLISLK
jgi:hypothetical protein